MFRGCDYIMRGAPDAPNAGAFEEHLNKVKSVAAGNSTVNGMPSLLCRGNAAESQTQSNWPPSHRGMACCGLAPTLLLLTGAQGKIGILARSA
jgi:hypothetical protein